MIVGAKRSLHKPRLASGTRHHRNRVRRHHPFKVARHIVALQRHDKLAMQMRFDGDFLAPPLRIFFIAHLDIKQWMIVESLYELVSATVSARNAPSKNHLVLFINKGCGIVDKDKMPHTGHI